MQSHEMSVKNKLGKTLTVSVEHYEANTSDLTPVDDNGEDMAAKDIKARTASHYKTKESAVAEMQEADQKKMEKEALKNKGR